MENSASSSGSTIAFRLTLAWILASVAGFVVNLAPIRSSLVDRHYLPIGPDGFYHSRRILDAVADLASFFQFDKLIHAPDGALVSWPWAYDYVVSLIVKAGLALGLSTDPMAIIVHIPVVAFPLALLIVIGICRVLGMSVPATALALACTVLFPFNQSLYSIGNIDHHFAEHLLVLGSLACALAWLAKPQSTVRAVATGAILGIAPGVHTAEFILQLPLLLTFALVWLRGGALPQKIPVFVASLMIGTLAIALPSLALQQGKFDYLTLSWFQVYIAFCSSIMCLVLWRWPFRRNTLIAAAVLAAVLVLPIVQQILAVRDFFSSAVEGLDYIAETHSIPHLLERGYTVQYIFGYYTYLILLIPVVLLVGVLRLRKETEPMRMHFWIASIFGLAMLLMQARLHYFGSFALYLPILLLADEKIRQSLKWRPAVAWVVVSVVILAACSSGVTSRLFEPRSVAGDPDYAMLRTMYEKLGAECKKNPGVVLADPMDGNYLRFHTDCAAIGTAFLLTPQDVAKNREERALLATPAAELLKRNPLLRYLLIHRDTMFVTAPNGMLIVAPADHPALVDPPLVKELLHTDPGQFPEKFRLIEEFRYPMPPRTAYARLFAIEQDR